MLFILSGSNYTKIRKHTETIINNLKNRKTESEYIRVTAQTECENLESVLNTESLFGKKKIVFFDNVFENKETKDIFEKNIEEIINSKNFFLLLEYSLPPSFLKKKEIIKNLKKITIKKIEKTETQIKQNFFHLSDLLIKQKRNALWIAFCRESTNKENTDSIISIISWQMKMILLAHTCKNAKEAKTKEFVFKKSKEAAKKITKEKALWMLESLQKENFNYIKKIPKRLQIENWILKNIEI